MQVMEIGSGKAVRDRAARRSLLDQPESYGRNGNQKAPPRPGGFTRRMNKALPRVIIAPLTRKGQSLGCRPELLFDQRPARILLDQLRCVDKQRLLNKIGEIELRLWHSVLLEMLA